MPPEPEPVPEQVPEVEVAPEQPAPAPAAQPITFSLSSVLRCAKIFTIVWGAVMLFLGFILQIAGVSKTLDDCKELMEDFKDARSGSGLETAGLVYDINCDDIVRPFWWASCFHSIVIAGIGIAAMLKIMKDMRLSLLALLIIATLQNMDRAEEALDIRNRSLFEETGGRIAAAGFVISSMVDFILLFKVATENMPHPQMPRFQLTPAAVQP